MENYRWICETFMANELDGPFTLKADKEYLPALKEKLDLIDRYLIEYCAPEYVCKTIKDISEKLLEAMDSYYHGDIGEAQDAVIQIIKKVKKLPLAVSQIEDSISFIGPWHRMVDYKKRESPAKLFHARTSKKIVSFSREDMKHIPFGKRDLMQPQRFSLSGLPCYYLASTSYCCWIELDRPSESEFNVSAVRPMSSFKIFNLGISGATILHAVDVIEAERCNTLREDPAQVILSLACLRVLAIATSFCVERSADHVPFKSEYILSQLIMLAVKRLGLDGIAYFSKRLESDKDAFPLSVNLALFALYKEKENEFSVCDKLKISEPANYAEFRQIEKEIPEERVGKHNNVDVKLAGKSIYYPRTYFYALDNYLQNRLDWE